jgi:PAS domain S-box
MKEVCKSNLSIIAHDAPLGMALICSSNGVYLEANKAYCEILGQSKNGLVGRTWMEFTYPADIPRDEALVRELFTTGVPQVHSVKRYSGIAGKIIYANAILMPFSINSINPIFLVLLQDLAHLLTNSPEQRIRFDERRRRREEVMNALVMVSRFRDRETGEHLRRTRSYMRLMLESLGPRQPFSRQGIELVANASMLHDIGKIGIPDSVLLKPGRLTVNEMAVMKTHTKLGARALNETMRTMHGDTSLLFAREIAEFHHERWDGFGYPYGFAEERIPLTSRIMSIIDVYDALRSVRPYKGALNHQESIRIIRAESGTHFDPSLVKVFLERQEDIAEIAEREKDSTSPFH